MKIYAVLYKNAAINTIHLVTTHGWIEDAYSSHHEYMIATTKEEFDDLLSRFDFRYTLAQPNSNFFTVELDV